MKSKNGGLLRMPALKGVSYSFGRLRWNARYNEVKNFIEANKRNPSKHRIEEHDMLNWIKANRKVMNAGKMKPERVEKLTIVDFRHDSTMIKRAYHCARCSESLENFWN